MKQVIEGAVAEVIYSGGFKISRRKPPCQDLAF